MCKFFLETSPIAYLNLKLFIQQTGETQSQVSEGTVTRESSARTWEWDSSYLVHSRWLVAQNADLAEPREDQCVFPSAGELLCARIIARPLEQAWSCLGLLPFWFCPY